MTIDAGDAGAYAKFVQDPYSYDPTITLDDRNENSTRLDERGISDTELKFSDIDSINKDGKIGKQEYLKMATEDLGLSEDAALEIWRDHSGGDGYISKREFVDSEFVADLTRASIDVIRDGQR